MTADRFHAYFSHEDLMARAAVGFFSLGILLGFSLLHGGLFPAARALMLIIFSAAALFAVLSKNVSTRLKLPLLAPGIAALASLPFAEIPLLGYEQALLALFIGLLASTLSGLFAEPLTLFSILAGGMLLAVSILMEAPANVMISGAAGLAQGSGGAMMGANIAAIMLASTIAPYWFLLKDGRLNRIFAGLYAAMAVTALILTQSRTGVIAVACALFFTLLELPRKRKLQVIAVAAAMLAAGSVFYLPRLAAKFDPSYITNMQRLSMMRGVADAFKSAPLLGHGAWSFPVVGQTFLEWPKWELHPHSLPLRIIFESGLAGLFLWLWMLWKGFRKNMANRAEIISVGAAAGIVGGSLTDDPTWIPFALVMLLSSLGYGMEAVRSSGKKILLGAIACGVALSAVIPLARSFGAAIPLAPACDALSAHAREGTAPDFAGWRNDPVALRIAGYAKLDRGDTAEAVKLFKSANLLDRKMIFVPSLFDIAWSCAADGRTAEAEAALREAELIAPVLTARFRGETGVVHASWIDRHYGVEFPSPSAVTPEMIEPVFDKLDWRCYRYEGAQALLKGDREAAKNLLEKGFRLALREYGVDPVMCRWLAELDGARARDYASMAARRDGAVFPYDVLAPLIFRYDLRGSCDNSPWWRARMQGKADEGA